MKAKIPKSTRAILIRAFSEVPKLEVGEKPLKKPSPSEVLIKMEAAPINPSDILFTQGKYGQHYQLPWIPGYEGAGTVVFAGKKHLTLLGQRVACRFQSGNDGTWAEYTVTDGSRCVPLPKNADFSMGANNAD